MVADVGALPNRATASVQPCSLGTTGVWPTRANASRRALDGAIFHFDPCPPKHVTCYLVYPSAWISGSATRCHEGPIRGSHLVGHSSDAYCIRWRGVG